MTAGLSTAKIAAILNVYRATAYSAVTPWIKLHIGDPGSVGTANASAVTTRNQLTLAAPSGNSAVLSAISNYSMTTTETISHISIWDASTAGNFQESWALTGTVPVINGSVLALTVFTLAYSPQAA